MAIYLYYGKPGDGKSYHVTLKELLPALTQRRRVYTNIEGILEPRRLKSISEITSVPVHELESLIVSWENTPFEDIRSWLVMDENDKQGDRFVLEKNALIIIDEAHFIWDARDFKNASSQFHHFLSYHRHWGLDLVFVTQHVKRMDANIARLANSSYQVKNLAFIGSLVRSRYVLHERQTPFDRDIIATYSGVYDKKIFACYKSFVARSGFKRSSRGVLSGALSFGLIFCILLFSYFMFKNGGLGIFNIDKNTGVAHAQNVGQSVDSRRGGGLSAVYTTSSVGPVAHFPTMTEYLASQTAPAPAVDLKNCSFVGELLDGDKRYTMHHCEGGVSKTVLNGSLVAAMRLSSGQAVAAPVSSEPVSQPQVTIVPSSGDKQSIRVQRDVPPPRPRFAP